MDKIWEKIKEYDVITIFGHVIPDGECYGSQMGLKNAILDNFEGKKVYALGSGWPKFFSLMGEMDIVDDETIASSLAICLDCANEERIEDQRFKKAKEIIKIDHHIEQGEFKAWITHVDNDKIATCEIITELIVKSSLKLTKAASLPLFLGLVTDSGRFLYQPIDPFAYIAASKLVETGIDVSNIYDVLYEVDEKSLRFKGYIFSSYKKTEHGVIYLPIPKEVIHEYGIDYNAAASMVNSVANIKGSPIWVFFSESDEGTVRVEFRSKGVEVQPIAAKYGGGGHPYAAGCKLDNLEDHKYIVNDLDKLLK